LLVFIGGGRVFKTHDIGGGGFEHDVDPRFPDGQRQGSRAMFVYAVLFMYGVFVGVEWAAGQR
jgi:hypothetical protein